MICWREATTLDRILAAAKRAARGKRDRPPVARFLMDAETECLRLQRALRLPVDAPGSWWPLPTATFQIRDPKPRTITVAPFPDRVVHHVLCAAIEPMLERYSIHHSYACWTGRGQQRALRQCQIFARKRPWVLRADIASFFASIPHGLLLAQVRSRLASPEIYDRVARALAGPPPGIPVRSGRGLPIGALTSQHMANLYLGILDHWITDGLGFGRYLRYMDDFAVFGEREELRELLTKLRRFLRSRLDLRLNERRSFLQPVRDGVPFLGFRVYRDLIRVSPERWRRFRRRQRRLEDAFDRGDLDEETLAGSLSSQYAHLTAFDTLQARRRHLRRLAERRGRGLQSLQPGDSRRLVEERTPQRAGGQPQQEAALQPQRQPGLSRGELNAPGSGPLLVRSTGPVGTASRSGAQRPGIDPPPVLCSGSPALPVSTGTEAKPPGGGTRGVAAGHSSSRRP